MNNNNKNNLKRLAGLFNSYSTAPTPKQLKFVLSELEYKRFCEALGLYEVKKIVISEPEKECLCWSDLPNEEDIYFFQNYGYLTI